MKILRVRRGFTTNSSGTNEWIPTQQVNGNTPPVNQTWNNMGKMSLLLAFVAVLVLLDQFTRKILSIKSKRRTEDNQQ